MVAGIIINISHEAVDRPFEYLVPIELENKIKIGARVNVPFGNGNNIRRGYVISLSDKSEYPIDKLKSIDSIDEKSVDAMDEEIELAAWIRYRYGSTMNAALQTVLPVKKKIKENSFRTICLNVDEAKLDEQIGLCNSIKFAGRKKLLAELKTVSEIPEKMAIEKLGISQSVIKTLEKNGVIRLEASREYRIPKINKEYAAKNIVLSSEQQTAIDNISRRMNSDNPGTTLLYGITGSGKTEVYLELISQCISKGKQAIVLIPEISLTFQTLMRFYARFGDRVSLTHSRLSDGEKFDQYERAKNNEIDVIIGPRSALFTPFKNLGIIVIDEEHETSYKSEKMPKYHAREVADHIAKKHGALLLLGSATPSMESYYKALNGEYSLEKLSSRNNARPATVHKVDMREELKKKNKSLFSEKLRELLTECIANGEQAMLFINRRGYAGFVSCRECGFVMKCPHCDVSLSEHKGAQGRPSRLVCHYCGYESLMNGMCPECGSKFYAGFKAGTEKIQLELEKLYPSIRVLRMDADTTKNKDDYDRILSEFSAGQADVLVGTQMIVKGHDFPMVTLVGVIAADQSLFASDYRAAERTFQLVTQAAGRAGRGSRAGNVVIQTYQPDNYAIIHAGNQDYDGFYNEEIEYRDISDYPPVGHMLSVQFYARTEQEVMDYAKKVADNISGFMKTSVIIGPASAVIAKIKDIYRAVFYIKDSQVEEIIRLRDIIEKQYDTFDKKRISIQFDIDPVGAF